MLGHTSLMVSVNRAHYLGMGVSIAIFLLVLPLIINNGLSTQYVSNSSLDKFNNYTGVTLSYYAAIFGGLVGGIFTYAGVKLSLDNQEDLIKREAESHKKMLLTQLNYSYDLISSLDKANEDNLTHVALHLLIFDKNWYTHLPYIECLNQKDLEQITYWFYMLDGLEMKSRSSEIGGVSIIEAKKYHKDADSIKAIIDKIESNDS